MIIAKAQLVFDFSAQARQHEFLQRRYYEVLAEMDAENCPDSAASKKKWSAKLLTITADEPMMMRALDAIAYNQALYATHDDPTLVEHFRLPVNTWQYWLRNLYAFQRTNFHPDQKIATAE